MSRCIGCGVKIQTTNPSELGYVPEFAMIERGEKVYCKRCYDIRYHNKVYLPSYNPEAYYEKIQIIKKEKALVVLMIDVLDIYGGFIEHLNDCIGDNSVLIVVNKIDLLPKSLKLVNLEARIREIALSKKLHVEGVLMISANDQKMVQKVIAKISKLKYPQAKNKYQHHREVRFGNCYIVGCASVGKSTFMNKVLKMTMDIDENTITTSNQYQTTLDFIKWPLDRSSYIIDTPGIINSKHFGAYLSNRSLQVLIASKYIKPRTYQLNTNQSILLGGLARIDFETESKINASFYVANELYLHRTKTSQVQDVMASQKLKMLVPPFEEEELEKLSDTITYEFFLNQPSELFISGIGFIHFVGENSLIKLTISKKILIEFKESFM